MLPLKKEFAHKESKFFPFRADTFSEGKQNNFDTVASSESVSQFPLKFTANHTLS